ncbi:cadherin-23-like [Mya arenaria]|uniref:cadherin-23-like n=1 Tax=Mya arenaria TaxID=6604 RepID=UPI0022E6E5E0|nr:cadherin-23-like [Mya arenaria]
MNGKAKIRIIVVSTLMELIRRTDGSHGGGQCATTSYFGEDNPKSKDDRIDSNVDFTYMMNDPNYVINCCGVVDNWEAYFDNVNTARTVYFQVWRPTSGDSFQLVGQNAVSVYNDPFFTGTMSATVSNAVAIGTTLETISVSDNDLDDISTLTVSMVSNSKYSFDTSTMVLTTVASLATLGDSESKLRFKVADQCSNTVTVTFTVTITNDPPEIHNLPSSVSISEDVTSETLLYVINATDTANDVTCDLASGVPASYPFLVKEDPVTTDYGIYSEVNPGFSYNTKNSYTLDIDCSDGLASDTGQFYVYLVQNTPPVFINLQNSTSISTSDQIGTTAFHVLVNDTEGDDLTLTMTCTPAICPFDIFNCTYLPIIIVS